MKCLRVPISSDITTTFVLIAFTQVRTQLSGRLLNGAVHQTVTDTRFNAGLIKRSSGNEWQNGDKKGI